MQHFVIWWRNVVQIWIKSSSINSFKLDFLIYCLQVFLIKYNFDMNLIKKKIYIYIYIERLSNDYWLTWTVSFLFNYRVYDIEERIKTPRKFRFPQFEPVNWLAAQKLKNDLSDLNSDSTLCPSHLLSGIKALLQALKLWLPDLETKVCS